MDFDFQAIFATRQCELPVYEIISKCTSKFGIQLVSCLAKRGVSVFFNICRYRENPLAVSGILRLPGIL